MQACYTYAYLKTFLGKVEKHMWRGLFYESILHRPRPTDVKFNTEALLEI